MTPEIEAIREKLKAMMPELAEKYGVTELGIFGSRIRGDHRIDSDLDVLASFGRPIGLLKFCNMENLLTERLGLRVDLVPRDSLKPVIGRHILAEVNYL